MTNAEAKLTVTSNPSMMVVEKWDTGTELKLRPMSEFIDEESEAMKMAEALNILIQYAIDNI